jgi:hypothetical protein
MGGGGRGMPSRIAHRHASKWDQVVSQLRVEGSTDIVSYQSETNLPDSQIPLTHFGHPWLADIPGSRTSLTHRNYSLPDITSVTHRHSRIIEIPD